ncbi:MAG TPA: NUDIX hydrolase [Terrimesophilobacter sp.]|uniref:NUDIX hydrolase n=1 Tax=Terrimesophilobacter sp. TaxID=2906435 RepID=UPI002F95DCD9
MPEFSGSAGALADEAFRAKLLASETVFDGTVWNVNRDRFEFAGGELVREYQVHPGAVAVLAEDEAGRVLLIKQYRHPIGHRDWELPAGLLDDAGESPLDAAKRELAEEVDLHASEWSVLSEFFSSPGGSSEAITVYRARGLSPTEKRFARTAEEAEIQLRWVPLPEVVSAVLDGRLRNSILTIAVLVAHARG